MGGVERILDDARGDERTWGEIRFGGEVREFGCGKAIGEEGW